MIKNSSWYKLAKQTDEERISTNYMKNVLEQKTIH